MVFTPLQVMRQCAKLSAHAFIVGYAVDFGSKAAEQRVVLHDFKRNCTITVSCAQQFGKRFDFERVWLQQGISPALRDHVSLWVKEVTQALDDTKGTWSLSDWVKHPECGKTLLNQRFTAPVATPEWVK